MSDLDLGDDFGESGDTGTGGKFDMTKINPQILRLLIIIGIYLLGHSLLNSVIMLITGFPNIQNASLVDTILQTKLLKTIMIDSVITGICGIASAITLGTIFKINFGIGILLWLFILNTTVAMILRNMIYKAVYTFAFVLDKTIRDYKEMLNKLKWEQNNSSYKKYKKGVYRESKPLQIDFIDIFLDSLGGFSHIGTAKIPFKLFKKIILKTMKKYQINKNDPGLLPMLNTIDEASKKSHNILKIGDLMAKLKLNKKIKK